MAGVTIQHLVIPGTIESLSAIPGHADVEGILRVALMHSASVPGKSFHLAAHVISPAFQAAPDFSYTSLHSHDCDEIGVLIGGTGALEFRFEVAGERFTAESPCTVFIPGGTEHRMEALRGQGVFLCIHLNQNPAARA